MEFLLYDRKFKFVDDVLFSLYKRGNSKKEDWHVVKLTLDNGYKRLKEKQRTFYIIG